MKVVDVDVSRRRVSLSMRQVTPARAKPTEIEVEPRSRARHRAECPRRPCRSHRRCSTPSRRRTTDAPAPASSAAAEPAATRGRSAPRREPRPPRPRPSRSPKPAAEPVAGARGEARPRPSRGRRRSRHRRGGLARGDPRGPQTARGSDPARGAVMLLRRPDRRDRLRQVDRRSAPASERGAVVIDADQLAREAVAKGTPRVRTGRRRASARTSSAPTASSTVRALAPRSSSPTRAEAPPSRAIVHPEVARRFGEQVDELRDTDRVVVYVTPLLVELGLAPAFDVVVVVTASPHLRVSRVASVAGLSPDDVRGADGGAGDRRAAHGGGRRPGRQRRLAGGSRAAGGSALGRSRGPRRRVRPPAILRSMRFRAVFFDVGETLVHVDPSFADLFVTVLAGAGHDAFRRRGPRRLRARLRAVLRGRARRLDVDDDARALPCVLDVGVRADARRARRRRRRRARDRPSTASSRAWRTTSCSTTCSRPSRPSGGRRPPRHRVELRGVARGLVRRPRAARDRSPSASISGIEGIEKPDERIFRLALDRASVSAAESAYVGDNPEFDVDPPAALGMFPVLVDRRDRFPDHAGPRVTDLRDLPAVLGAAA